MSRVVQEKRTEENLTVVGTRQARYDADLKVAGTAVFGTDVHFANILYGKLLRSPHPHARIVKLDVSRASSFPGVRSVVTVVDFPEVAYGFAVKDQTLLPEDTVLYQGQPVCAVAADSPEIAEKAIAEIEVAYEVLPAVVTIDEALRDDSPPLHPEVGPVGSPPYKSRNVISFTRVHHGDLQRAFETADFVLEESYETSQVHQGYIEPRATTAEFDEKTGRIRVWTATQSPFWLRNSLAEVLGVPVSQVQVIPTHTGGGFGAKIYCNLEPFAVMLAKKARRPVKMVLTRREEFLAATPRPAMRIWIKSGVKDGKIVARQAKIVVDAGAYGSEGAVYANISAFAAVGPYNIANVDTEGISVYTNKQQAGAFRAPGTAETAFAVESHTDMLARKAGISPLDFRLSNVWEDGSLGPTGQVLTSVGLKDALRRVAERINYKELRSNLHASTSEQSSVRRGVGIACGLIPTVGIHSSAAYIKINEDGKVVVITGAQDTGAGAVTGLAMIAAEELGVNYRDVVIQSGDTDFMPWDGGSQGSRTTYVAGNAVLIAARDAREQLLNVAAAALKTEKSKIALKDGSAHVAGTNASMKFSEIAMRAQFNMGGPIVGKGFFGRDFPEHDKNAVEGFALLPSLHEPTYVAHAAQVEVDVGTGEVRVTRYVAAQDLGKCINPLGAEGQIQGGVAQGLGYALCEEMIHDGAGNNSNPNFTDYKLPTIMKVPLIEPIIVEGHYGGGPYGAKGVGEGNIVPPAAAVANAVYDATGARVRRVPLTPERVLASLSEPSG